MEINRSLIGTESASQFYNGRLKDFAYERIYVKYKKEIEDVLVNKTPGFFIWLDYPTHSRIFDGINSVLTTPEGIFSKAYPPSEGYDRLSISRASRTYGSITYVYGLYIHKKKPEKNPLYTDVQALCFGRPSEASVLAYENSHIDHIKSLPAQRQAYGARRQTSRTRLANQLTRPKATIDIKPVPKHTLEAQLPPPLPPQPAQSSLDITPEQLRQLKEGGVKEFYVFKF